MLQPTVTLASFAVLPPGMRWLELGIKPCAGPLLPVLARFSHLQSLTITSNGAGIEWAVGPRAVLAPLHELCLDHRNAPVEFDNGSVHWSVVDQLPPSASSPQHVSSLFAHHNPNPAMPHRLHMYECKTTHAVAAVQLLRQLRQLAAVSLGLHSCSGSDFDSLHPETEAWVDGLVLPPLASLAALSELHLAGWVQLPPDFRQLSQLQRLSVIGGTSDEGESYEWGAAPLSGLTSLRRVEIMDTQMPATGRSAGDSGCCARSQCWDRSRWNSAFCCSLLYRTRCPGLGAQPIRVARAIPQILRTPA